MLQDLSVSSMISEELTTFSDQVIAVTVPPFDAILTNRINKVKMYSAFLANAINRDKKSEFTPLLAKRDNERDNAFRSFNFAVLSAVFNNNPEINTAGKKIQEVIKRHDPSLYRLGYVAQTAEMKSLKLELDKSPEAIEAANVKSQYDSMKDSMVAFDLVNKQKTEAESGEKAPGIGASKKQLSRYIILLFKQIQILEEDEEEGIETLVKNYNKVINSTMALVKARKTRDDNKSDDDEDTPNSDAEESKE